MWKTNKTNNTCEKQTKQVTLVKTNKTYNTYEKQTKQITLVKNKQSK